jgi:phage shock protein G
MRGEKTMLELLFRMGFFSRCDWSDRAVQLLGLLPRLLRRPALMFVGGLFALMIKLLPWLCWPLRVVW